MPAAAIACTTSRTARSTILRHHTQVLELTGGSARQSHSANVDAQMRANVPHIFSIGDDRAADHAMRFGIG